MSSRVVTKYKQCCSCKLVQYDTDSRVFQCNECGHQCVDACNYWVLRPNFRKQVDKLCREMALFEADDLSKGLQNIKSAVENYRADGVPEVASQ